MSDQKVIEFHSTESTTVLYACGWCSYTARDRQLAEACCVCPHCGERVKGPGAQTCAGCSAKARAEREAAELERYWALPVVEDKGEPVLAGDRFYESADAAAEAIWDDSGDPTNVPAFPCTVTRALTPCIREYVEEHWSEQYDDVDACELMTKVAADACDALQAVLEAQAPTMWIPRMKERVALQPIDESSVVHLGGPNNG